MKHPIATGVVASLCVYMVFLWMFRSSNMDSIPPPAMSSYQNHEETNSENIKDFADASVGVTFSGVGQIDSRVAVVEATTVSSGDSVTKETKKDHVILITNGTEFSTFKEGVKYCPQLPPHAKCNFSYASHEVWNQSDAVVFRAFYVYENSDLWNYRPEGQKWIFDEHESPLKTWNAQRRENFDALWDQFNITVLYTKDASIQNYMYSFKCKLRPEKENVKTAEVDYLKGKQKSVLWIVSNCNWTMGRELYVEELKKYIDVDVLGLCGDGVVCGDYSALNTDCVNRLMEKYKYYLSFENSFCQGYYTEKANKALKVNTIPVVMGLVNYTELLAPGTFIDVRDYKSPKLLADYLKAVGSDPKLYNKYIKTKSRLDCSKTYDSDYMCKLCQYLHDNKEKTQILPNMREFWGKEKRCVSPDKFFKGVADDIIPRFRKRILF